MTSYELQSKELQRDHVDYAEEKTEGIETARLNGKQIGQRPGNKLHIKKEEPAKKLIIKYSRSFEGSLGDPEVIKLVGISRNTYYKYKREIRYGMK